MTSVHRRVGTPVVEPLKEHGALVAALDLAELAGGGIGVEEAPTGGAAEATPILRGQVDPPLRPAASRRRRGAAYVTRLEALARLERQFARRGETDPADLMEWLFPPPQNTFTPPETPAEAPSAPAPLACLS